MDDQNTAVGDQIEKRSEVTKGSGIGVPAVHKADPRLSARSNIFRDDAADIFIGRAKIDLDAVIKHRRRNIKNAVRMGEARRVDLGKMKAGGRRAELKIGGEIEVAGQGVDNGGFGESWR